jgi:hypothetical protein
MGVTTITPTPITPTGVNQATYMAACTACGDRFKAHGVRDFIRVTKTDADSIDVVIDNAAGGTDITVTVPATTGDKTIAFYATPTNVNFTDYVDADGYVNISYTGTVTANTKIGVFRLP